MALLFEFRIRFPETEPTPFLLEYHKVVFEVDNAHEELKNVKVHLAEILMRVGKSGGRYIRLRLCVTPINAKAKKREEKDPQVANMIEYEAVCSVLV